MEKFYHHSFKIGEFEDKTMLVHITNEHHGDWIDMHIRWTRTAKYLAMDTKERESWYSWGPAPKKINEVMVMWKNSPFFETMHPGDFVVKVLGIKKHWTEWTK